MAETGEGSKTAAAAPVKKKSLFSKPAYLNRTESQEAAESKEGIDFFSRAHEVFPVYQEQEKRRREKRLGKLERKRSNAGAEKKRSRTPELKRRRVSDEEEDREHSSGGDDGSEDDSSGKKREPSYPTPDSRKSGSSCLQPQHSPSSLSAQYSQALEDKKPGTSESAAATKNMIISLDSDEEDGLNSASVSKQQINLDDDDDDDVLVSFTKSIPARGEDDPHSEEEFPELLQKARERARQAELERQKATIVVGEESQAKSATDFDDVFEEKKPDAVVEILITSQIEGTVPMKFLRKISQRIKEVRLAWCERQIVKGAITAEQESFIKLTWNGSVLYDVAKCENLGIRAGIDGRVSSNSSEEPNRLHFEAWTDELLDAHQKAEQRRARGAEQVEVPNQDETASKIKLIMRAENMEDLRMKFRPEILIERLEQQFRKMHDIHEGRKMALYFDGDKLDPGTALRDTDLEDGDTIEVHIKG